MVVIPGNSGRRGEGGGYSPQSRVSTVKRVAGAVGVEGPLVSKQFY